MVSDAVHVRALLAKGLDSLFCAQVLDPGPSSGNRPVVAVHDEYFFEAVYLPVHKCEHALRREDASVDTDTAINVRYWISTDHPRTYEDLEGIDEFRSDLAADYVSVVKGRPAGVVS